MALDSPINIARENKLSLKLQQLYACFEIDFLDLPKPPEEVILHAALCEDNFEDTKTLVYSYISWFIHLSSLFPSARNELLWEASISDNPQEYIHEYKLTKPESYLNIDCTDF